jgi:hypothetical protein
MKADLTGDFVHPNDVRELASLMSDGDGVLSVVLIRAPADTVGWELEDAYDVQQLGIYMIELAKQMREGGKAP